MCVCFECVWYVHVYCSQGGASYVYTHVMLKANIEAHSVCLGDLRLICRNIYMSWICVCVCV